MSTTSEMLNEIREVNLSYLLLAQRLLREDKPMGMFRMGISDQLADVIANLSLAQTVKLAASSQVLCRFRFDDHAVLSALADKGKTSAIAQAHSAILMASQPVEQVGVKLHPLCQPRRKTSVGTRDQVCEISRHGLEAQVGEDRAVHGHARKEQRDVS